MNKHFLVFCFLLLTALQAHAQPRVEKFCEVITTPKNGWTTKRVSYLSIGLQPELFSFKDTSIISKLQKVNDLTTDADVLNYMSSLGWWFVSVIALPNMGEKLYFRKDFSRNELATQ